MSNWKSMIKSMDKGEGIYKIYALMSLEDFNDINKGDIIYIGITSKTLGKRLSGHKKVRDNWPSKISIILIENTNDKSRESFYIDFFKKMGCNLLNINNGIRPLVEKIVEKKEKLSIEEKKEKLKEYRKEYYKKNKEKLIKNMIEYQKNNEEKLKEYRKEYYKKYYKNRI